MGQTRKRVLAGLCAAITGLLPAVVLDPPASALSDPAHPWLALDRTIGSQPWGGAGASAFDLEGMAFLAFDDQIVVADDSADRVYFVNRTTGALVQTITQSAFAGALPLSGVGGAAGVGRADAFRAVAYDPSADSIYVFSGACCGTAPFEPAAFRLKRDAGGAFQVESYQALPEGTDAVAAGIRPGHGLYIGRGTRIRHYSYATNTIGADIQLTGTGTALLGMAFTDASTLVVTNSANQLIKVSTANWTAQPGWTLDLGAIGVVQGRSLAIFGDEFMIADGGDTRPPGDPLKYAIFVANLGEAPPIAAVFTPSATSGVAPLGVWFVDHSINATDYLWDFGDGTTATGAGAAHIYAFAGTFTARLTVTGPTGRSSATAVINVAPANHRSGGYTLDAFGGFHPFGVGTGQAPPAPRNAATWPGWDIARGAALRFDGTGGYTLDGFGGLHPFGAGATPPPSATGGPYWSGWDAARGVALMPNGQGGYIVDLFGGIHRFRVGTSKRPPAITGGPYWSGQDVARGIAILPDGTGGYVVDSRGALHPFGIGTQAAPPAPTNVWIGTSRRFAQGVAVLGGGRGGYTVEGNGVIHRFTTTRQSPAVTGSATWTDSSPARDIVVLAAT